MNAGVRKIKTAFLHTGTVPYPGIMAISAVLKEAGFATDVFSPELDGDITASVSRFKPDILAVSAMTPTFRSLMPIVRSIKKELPGLFVVVGGPHPTFFPDVIENEADIDAICRGEGEYPMLELARSLGSGRPDSGIRNLWIRNGNSIVKNDMRDLISDLDTLPFPDHAVYFDKYPFMAKRIARFTSSRGCPFDCSYCFNKGIRELYEGKGRWLRFRSVEKSIQEIEAVVKSYPVKWISFLDDTFNTDRKRLGEFLAKYKERVGIPFLCQIRVDLATEDQVDMLKRAGVNKISIGVEHGDEEFRRRVLYRKISDSQILDFAKWVRDRKIRLTTQNIMGFPGETVDLAFSTIELNAKIRPEVADVSILNPYPGTDIYRYAKDNGYLSADFSFERLVSHSNLYEDSSSRVKSYIKDTDRLITLRSFTMVLVWWPWLKPLVKLLIRLPYNRLYELVYQMTGALRITWRYGDRSERRAVIRKLVGLAVGSD